MCEMVDQELLPLHTKTQQLMDYRHRVLLCFRRCWIQLTRIRVGWNVGQLLKSNKLLIIFSLQLETLWQIYLLSKPRDSHNCFWLISQSLGKLLFQLLPCCRFLLRGHFQGSYGQVRILCCELQSRTFQFQPLACTEDTSSRDSF